MWVSDGWLIGHQVPILKRYLLIKKKALQVETEKWDSQKKKKDERKKTEKV